MRRGVDETKENLDDQPWLSEVEVLWFGGQERWRFQVSLLHSVVTGQWYRYTKQGRGRWSCRGRGANGEESGGWMIFSFLKLFI